MLDIFRNNQVFKGFICLFIVLAAAGSVAGMGNIEGMTYYPEHNGYAVARYVEPENVWSAFSTDAKSLSSDDLTFTEASKIRKSVKKLIFRAVEDYDYKEGEYYKVAVMPDFNLLSLTIYVSVVFIEDGEPTILKCFYGTPDV